MYQPFIYLFILQLPVFTFSYRTMKLFIVFVIAILLLQVYSEAFAASDGLKSHNNVHGSNKAPLHKKFPLRKKINCSFACAMRCREASRKNVCGRACNACCTRCHCVPPGTYGNHAACPCYANLKTHGNKRKCP